MSQFINMGITDVNTTFKNLPVVGLDGVLNGASSKAINYAIIPLKIKKDALPAGKTPIVNIKSLANNKTYAVNRAIVANAGFNNLVKVSKPTLTSSDATALYNLQYSTTPGVKFLFDPQGSTIADDMWTSELPSASGEDFNSDPWKGPTIIAVLPMTNTNQDLPSIINELEIEVGTVETGAPTTPTAGSNNGISIGISEPIEMTPISFAIGGVKTITTTTVCDDGQGNLSTVVKEKRVQVAGDCARPIATV